MGAVTHASPAAAAIGGAISWGYDPRERCAEIGTVTNVNPANGAFGGAPCGATILVRGVPK
eukprot:7177435-Pyramimonas_sp.AAC.1